MCRAIKPTPAADSLELELLDGRIEIDVPASTTRQFKITVSSATGDSVINRSGRYTLELSRQKQLQVTVRDGELTLTTTNRRATQTLSGNQRALATPDGAIRDTLPAPTNLVRNGFFRAPLSTDPPSSRDWLITTESLKNDAERGRGSFSKGDGVLTIERSGAGIGWGRKTISQAINEDVQGRRALRLRVAFTILEQELSVCGGEGSECPLFARINYIAADTTQRSWLQGFYAKGDPEGEQLPTFLKQNRGEQHIAKSLGQPETFETGNLLDELPDMRTVQSIELYSEGHALKVQINSVELLLEE